MKQTNYFTVTLFMIWFIIISAQTILAFDTSQQLQYENFYHLSSSELNHTLTLNIDYFQEISDDLFLEGDLVIRTNNKSYAQPLIVGPNEIYISAYNITKNLDLKAGKVITRWGAADLFSPLDNFNPIPPNISLVKKPDKLGVLGTSIAYYINDLTFINAVFLPKLKTTPYPDQYLKDSYLNQYQPIYQVQGLNIDTVELTYLPTDNMIWGLRLSHSFPSFDAAISYYRGYYMDPFPVRLSTKSNAFGTTLTVKLGYPAKQVWGLEFQGDFPGIEGATLRGDLAYVVPENCPFQKEELWIRPFFKTESVEITTPV